MWFYLSVIFSFPRPGWDLLSLLKFPVVRIKKIVAALLLASDTYLIRSEPLTLGCTDPLSVPSALIFKSCCLKQSHRRGCFLYGALLNVETEWVPDDECFWPPGKVYSHLSWRCTSKASGHILALVSSPSWPKSPFLLVQDLWCPRFGFFNLDMNPVSFPSVTCRMKTWQRSKIDFCWDLACTKEMGTSLPPVPADLLSPCS